MRSSGIPGDLTGKTVLDMGCWDGLYSFECESRGARVTAVDDRSCMEFVCARYGVEMPAEPWGFDVARHILGSQAEFVEMGVYDLPGLGKSFDVTLCMGLIYHVRYPLLALETAAAITRETIVLESHYELVGEAGVSFMRFFPGSELNGDPTCWWGPSIPCLRDMLAHVGFGDIDLELPYWNDNARRVLLRAHRAG